MPAKTQVTSERRTLKLRAFMSQRCAGSGS